MKLQVGNSNKKEAMMMLLQFPHSALTIAFRVDNTNS